MARHESAAGLFPLPTFRNYCANKFGTLEDISQRLDGDLFCPAYKDVILMLAEVDPKWNIKVRPFAHTYDCRKSYSEV